MSSTSSRKNPRKLTPATSQRSVRGRKKPAGKKVDPNYVGPEDNLFEALGVEPAQARVESLKTDLLGIILDTVRRRKITNKDLGEIWKKPKTRVSEILNGKLHLVSLDTLVKYLYGLDVEVAFKVKKAG